jgi:hypothetical protein
LEEIDLHAAVLYAGFLGTMFSIDANTLKNKRLVIPPLDPIGKAGYLEPVSSVSIKAPAADSDDAGSSDPESVSSDDEPPDVWTTKPNGDEPQNLVGFLCIFWHM